MGHRDKFQHTSLPPARLLTFSFYRYCGVLGRKSGVAKAVFLCLSTNLHELGRRLRIIKSPIERRHAPGKVCTARVRAGVPVVGRRTK
jgi:hypothetical protein